MTPRDERLSMLVRDALRAARPELGEIATRAGVNKSAMYQYSAGNRTPKPSVLRAIAKALRFHAGTLTAWADQLDAEANRNS